MSSSVQWRTSIEKDVNCVTKIAWTGAGITVSSPLVESILANPPQVDRLNKLYEEAKQNGKAIRATDPDLQDSIAEIQAYFTYRNALDDDGSLIESVYVQRSK